MSVSLSVRKDTDTTDRADSACLSVSPKDR